MIFVFMYLFFNRLNVRYNNNFSDNFILLVMVCIIFSLFNSYVFLKRRLLMNGIIIVFYFVIIYFNVIMVFCDVIGKLLFHISNEVKENGKF